MKLIPSALIAAALALGMPLAALAQASTPGTAAAAQTQSTGVVKKVDAEQGKITISHGPLANLDMPAMTMVFRVADPKMLETVKAGDNIKFQADKVNGAYTVMSLEKAG